MCMASAVLVTDHDHEHDVQVIMYVYIGGVSVAQPSYWTIEPRLPVWVSVKVSSTSKQYYIHIPKLIRRDILLDLSSSREADTVHIRTKHRSVD